jgi:hypothetical protein
MGRQTYKLITVTVALCRGERTNNNDIGTTCTGELRDVYKILVGKLKGKRPFGNPRCRQN